MDKLRPTNDHRLKRNRDSTTMHWHCFRRINNIFLHLIFYAIFLNFYSKNSFMKLVRIFGRVYFLLRSISNLKSISDLRQRNLLRSISNVKRGTFLNPPHQITFSKPSQDIQGGPSQSEYLLRSFSNLPHQITFSKPSQLILKWSMCSTSQSHLRF